TKVSRLQEALEEAEAASDLGAALGLSEQLGDLFCKVGEYRRAAEAYEKQLGHAQALGRTEQELAVIHVSLAATYGDLKDYVRAVQHYQAELALRRGNPLETLRHLQASQQRCGCPAAAMAETSAHLQAVCASHDRHSDGESSEEEELHNSQALEASDPELSDSDEEEDMEGYCKTWNQRNDKGETLLHRACIEGNLRQVQYFLEKGLSPLGTLQAWVQLYGKDLDSETHHQCRAMESLLRKTMAEQGSWPPPPRGETPSQLFDAELSEPQVPCSPSPPPKPPSARQCQQEADEDYMVSLRPVKKKQRLLDQALAGEAGPAPPADYQAAMLGLGSAPLRLPPSPKRHKGPPRPALIPADEYVGDDWLEDDLAPSTGFCSALPLQLPLPPVRVRVRVQDSVFLIPVPQSWLLEGGALLAPQDSILDALQSNEEVLAEVQSWDLPPLLERYRKACQTLALSCPLLRALKLQASLRQLCLSGTGLGTTAEELQATLGTIPGLKHLDLSANWLGPDGLQKLAAGLPAPLLSSLPFESLTHLEVGSLEPRLEDRPQLRDAVVRYLTQEGCALSHLGLSGNHLDDDDVAELARLFCPWTLGDATWTKLSSLVGQLQLCSRQLSRSDQRDVAQLWRTPANASLHSVTRHHKLFCHSL
ncbi:hypothetical protein E2320_022986, partial [Naja naja]